MNKLFQSYQTNKVKTNLDLNWKTMLHQKPVKPTKMKNEMKRKKKQKHYYWFFYYNFVDAMKNSTANVFIQNLTSKKLEIKVKKNE